MVTRGISINTVRTRAWCDKGSSVAPPPSSPNKKRGQNCFNQTRLHLNRNYNTTISWISYSKSRVLLLLYLDLVGEGHDVVRFLPSLLAEVVVPRSSDRLVDVSVGRGVEDLRHRHPETQYPDGITSIVHDEEGGGGVGRCSLIERERAHEIPKN